MTNGRKRSPRPSSTTTSSAPNTRRQRAVWITNEFARQGIGGFRKRASTAPGGHSRGAAWRRLARRFRIGSGGGGRFSKGETDAFSNERNGRARRREQAPGNGAESIRAADSRDHGRSVKADRAAALETERGQQPQNRNQNGANLHPLALRD